MKSDSKKEEIIGNATTLVPIDNNQNEGIDGIAENATASIPTDNNEEYDVETDVDGHGKDGVDASPYDSDSDSSDSSEDDSDSSNESDLDDEDDVKVPGREVAGANNNVIEEDASMNQLFDTNLFQFKSTWKLAQVLHTMKDAIKYTEDNIEGCIEAERVHLSPSEKKKKKEKIKRELAEKQKQLTQLLSIVHEEQAGSIAPSDKSIDDDDDNDETRSLERSVTKFRTLLGKKGLTKDNVTKMQVNDVQVTALQAMMASQPLHLHEWVHLYGHRIMEARSNVDEIAHLIRKLHDSDAKQNYPSTDGTTKFKVQFRKGTEEEFPEESTFIIDAVNAVKDEHKRAIGNCIGMTQMLHYERELNELTRTFLDFYLKVAGIMAMTELRNYVESNGNGNDMNPSALATMRHNSEAIAEQNLARLLMKVHKPEGLNMFKYLKRKKYEVLTILRKRKHKNRTIEEFIEGSCNFQHYHRHNFLFLAADDWAKRKLKLDSAK